MSNFLIVAVTGHPVIAHSALTVYYGADFFLKLRLRTVLYLNAKQQYLSYFDKILLKTLVWLYPNERPSARFSSVGRISSSGGTDSETFAFTFFTFKISPFFKLLEWHNCSRTRIFSPDSKPGTCGLSLRKQSRLVYVTSKYASFTFLSLQEKVYNTSPTTSAALSGLLSSVSLVIFSSP